MSDVVKNDGDAVIESGDSKQGSGDPSTSSAGAKEEQQKVNLDSKIQAMIEAKTTEIQKVFEEKLAEKDRKIQELNKENRDKRLETKSKEEREQILQRELEDERSAKEEAKRIALEKENAYKATLLEKEKYEKIVADVKAKEETKKKDLLQIADKLSKKDPSILKVAQNIPDLEALETYLNQFKPQPRVDTFNTYSPPGISEGEEVLNIKLPYSDILKKYQEDPEKFKEMASKLPGYIG